MRSIIVVWCFFIVGLGDMAAARIHPNKQPFLQRRALELADMFRLQRVSDPHISPDGKYIAYVVGEVNLTGNSVNSDIWLVPTGKPDEARRIVASPKADNHPRWSPDGKTLSFVSTRSGTAQVYLLAISDILASKEPSGKERQLTTLFTGASRQMFSPDGSKIAFISSVYPEFSHKPFAEADGLNKHKAEALDKSPMKAVVFDKLLYRHWDSWTDFTRQHIFVQSITGGEPKNVTPGERDAVPNADTFSAGDDYAWSPDGKEIAYTITPEPVREEAWLTNHDIMTVNLQTGEQKQITSNPGADVYPRYSPDGSMIAYRAQQTPGFEAERWQVMVYDRKTGNSRSLTTSWDFAAQQIAWSPDAKYIITDADDNAEVPLWALPLNAKEAAVKLVATGANSSFSFANDGTLCFAASSLTQPAEIFTITFGKKPEMRTPQATTRANAEMFSGIELAVPEKITFMGATVKNQAWLVKPPKFDPTKKYPTIMMIHGGPQGAWNNAWSNRWNMQLWAAQGYIVVAPNPTGSTGFGQKFTNEVSGDWGGKPYTDIMKCIDYVVQTYPFVDSTRIAAAGASYGGYMVNWMATQTRRFKTFVSHCGVYNFASMYGTTDEIWFEEWEHGKPWEDKGKNNDQRHSPHHFVNGIQTPMLIIHDGNDFRVPLQEGMQLFTALQRRGIPSKFLYIPNEGHWVLKPQNSEFWHTTIFDWLAGWLQPTR